MVNKEMKKFAESYKYLYDMAKRVPDNERGKIITALVSMRLYYGYPDDVCDEFLRECDN